MLAAWCVAVAGSRGRRLSVVVVLCKALKGIAGVLRVSVAILEVGLVTGLLLP